MFTGLPTKTGDNPLQKTSLTNSKLIKPKMTEVTKRNLETQFNNKKKKLLTVKKELEEKQVRMRKYLSIYLNLGWQPTSM